MLSSEVKLNNRCCATCERPPVLSDTTVQTDSGHKMGRTKRFVEMQTEYDSKRTARERQHTKSSAAPEPQVVFAIPPELVAQPITQVKPARHQDHLYDRVESNSPAAINRTTYRPAAAAQLHTGSLATTPFRLPRQQRQHRRRKLSTIPGGRQRGVPIEPRLLVWFGVFLRSHHLLRVHSHLRPSRVRASSWVSHPPGS